MLDGGGYGIYGDYFGADGSETPDRVTDMKEDVAAYEDQREDEEAEGLIPNFDQHVRSRGKTTDSH